MTLTAAPTTATSFDLGPARALSCRECGHEIPLAPEFACPSASVRSRSPTTSATSPAPPSRPGPKSIWRYRQLLPVPADVSRAPEHRARPDPADQGGPAGRGPGRPVAVGEGRHRQPDALVQGPGRRRRARRRPRAGLHRAGLPVHRQPGQRRRRGGRPRGLGLRRAHPLVAGAGQDPHHRRLRRHAAGRRRQLRRRQPAGHRAGRRARGLGVRQRQRPARTTRRARRRWATRSPSSSGGGCPARSWCPWRRARS